MDKIFITGGTSGIGLELAKYYLNKGHRVGVCGRDEQKFLENFDPDRQEVVFFQVDVTNRVALKEAITEFSKPTGLNLIITSAGIAYKHKTRIPDFDYSYKMVEVNLLGTMYAFEAALEVMVPQGHGQMVAIGSLAGFNGLPGTSAYSASKAAVYRFCESLAIDLKDLNIDVTCITPGFVQTPLPAVNTHPMPFLITAPEAARKIAYAIIRRKHNYAFPFGFGLMVKFLSVLPRFIYRWLMLRDSFNYSSK